MAAALLNPSPFFPRAEQSGAHGVLYHRAAVSTCCHASPSKDLVFVVNPKGGSGRTGREWKKLLPHVKTCVGQQCNVHEFFTSSPSQAVDITREAIRNGVDAVIAVGGDGTLHEVVNGFFWAGKPVRSLDRSSGHVTALGLIPLGTGSDFARTFDWKNDPHEAVKRIAKGLRSKIDIGLITGSGGEHHYFINEADIHLSARGGYYSSMYKPFGNFCYILAGLRAFIGHRNLDFKMKVDDEDWKVYEKVTTLCIGNGKFFGGGMKIVPNADPYNGKLEVVLLQEFKWYDFLFRLYKLYIGSHLSEPNVHSMGVQSIEVAAAEEGQGEIFVQSDGEHFGFLPIKCSILPAAIDFLA